MTCGGVREEYAANGHVIGLTVDGGRISVRVLGTDEYRVGMWAASGALEYDCTCPVGRDGGFCKHCVAGGLVWPVEGSPDRAGSRRGRPGAPRVVSVEEIRPFLGRQDRATLVDPLVDHVVDDEGLLDRLDQVRRDLRKRERSASTPTENHVYMSDERVRSCGEDGYLFLPGCFSPEEMKGEEISAVLSA